MEIKNCNLNENGRCTCYLKKCIEVEDCATKLIIKRNLEHSTAIKYIQLKTKKQFKEVMKKYNKKHESWMWDGFRENTCYIPSENYFISLDKVLRLNFSEILNN